MRKKMLTPPKLVFESDIFLSLYPGKINNCWTIDVWTCLNSYIFWHVFTISVISIRKIALRVKTWDGNSLRPIRVQLGWLLWNPRNLRVFYFWLTVLEPFKTVECMMSVWISALWYRFCEQYYMYHGLSVLEPLNVI